MLQTANTIIPFHNEKPPAFFDVEMLPLTTKVPFGNGYNYENIPEAMAMAVVNSETQQPLGIHTNSYKLVSHKEVYDAVCEAVEESNISKDYKITLGTMRDGAQFRGEIIFDDLIIEPVVDDVIKYRLRFWNSYDGSLSIGIMCDGLRLWCLNGCTTPDTIAGYRAKHTSNINIKGMGKSIGHSLDMFHNNRDVYKRMAETKLVYTNMEDRLMNFCFYKTASGKIKLNEKRFADIKFCIDKNINILGCNLWALYNGLTQWATHIENPNGYHSGISREREIHSYMSNALPEYNKLSQLH